MLTSQFDPEAKFGAKVNNGKTEDAAKWTFPLSHRPLVNRSVPPTS
jgi:hypothetical protein